MPNLLAVTSENSNDNRSTANSLPCYQADQQVKYLHLQAEIDVLLQQLQTLKQQQQPDTLVTSRHLNNRSILSVELSPKIV